MISALTAIDHVGIAVDDLEAAVEHYRRTLGVKPVLRERVVDQGVEEVLFAAGGSYIQLLGALGPDTPVGRFLATNGPGIHHVAYRVSDVAVDARAAPPRERASDRRGPARRLAQHAHRVRASRSRWAASWWSSSRRASAQEGRSVRPGFGAWTSTATLPSGSLPSPISWWTCPTWS